MPSLHPSHALQTAALDEMKAQAKERRGEIMTQLMKKRNSPRRAHAAVNTYVVLRVSQAFEEWRAMYCKRRAAAKRVRRALLKLTMGKLSLAFAAWRCSVAEATVQAEAIRKALFRFELAKVFAAFNAWREAAAEAKHTEKLLRGAVLRMKNRKLSAGFETWQTTAAEGKVQAVAIRSALVRMRSTKLSAAFDKWRGIAATLAAAFEADLPPYETPRGVLNDGERQAVSRALSRWRTTLLWQNSYRIRASQAIHEMKGFSVEVSFLSWRVEALALSQEASVG